jgi:hypothetical protein
MTAHRVHRAWRRTRCPCPAPCGRGEHCALCPPALKPVPPHGKGARGQSRTAGGTVRDAELHGDGSAREGPLRRSLASLSVPHPRARLLVWLLRLHRTLAGNFE